MASGGGVGNYYGKIFESMFQLMCSKSSVVCTRIPDGCRQTSTRNIVRVRTPWDWVITYRGRTAMIDTKTLDDKSFAYSRITPHQVREMISHEIAGGIAGYVIWLRQTDEILFIRASTLDAISHQSGSIHSDSKLSILLGRSNSFNVPMILTHSPPQQASATPLHSS